MCRVRPRLSRPWRHLEDLGASRLAVVDPYPADLNAKMAEYLAQLGFRGRFCRESQTSFTKSSVASVADIYRAARKAAKEVPNAEAIFIPCTNFPVVDVITDIETDTGLPVIANITSQLYSAFKAIGMREKIRRLRQTVSLL